ncbi:uncharacterized protein LOC111086377, partial [Limulus polyphemus]|uniref:Uncharacterized protein LOC111086377 n=1 Tax=Limulus polyphemus TaxID=6850 RepID=A0ABM1SM28_LIMPO
MPFVDDELFWCADVDGKIVDLSCLDSGPNVIVQQQPEDFQVLPNTDHPAMVHGLEDEQEELLRQLSEPGLELDNLFTNTDVKVDSARNPWMLSDSLFGLTSSHRKRKKQRSYNEFARSCCSLISSGVSDISSSKTVNTPDERQVALFTQLFSSPALCVPIKKNRPLPMETNFSTSESNITTTDCFKPMNYGGAKN